MHPTRLIRIDKKGDTINLRVIDNPVRVPRYVAISHTWSSDNGLLDKSCLEKFCELVQFGDGSYTDRINRVLNEHDVYGVVAGLVLLAQKITDLGGYNKTNEALTDERLWSTLVNHFWVDAICIDQQDPDDKTVDLPHMHTIYKDATAVVCLMQPISGLGTCNTATNNFRWFRRVWTYQELHLNDNLWVLDTSVTPDKWASIIDSDCNKEREHCKNRSAEYIREQLAEFRTYLSAGYICVGNIPLIEMSTYRLTVLPHIEDKDNPVSKLPELNNYLIDDTKSLAKLMYYTRHREAKLPEDRVIGVTGMLDIVLSVSNLYGKGEVGVLNRVLMDMPSHKRALSEAHFMTYRWYHKYDRCTSILDKLLPYDDRESTFIPYNCEFRCNDKRDISVLSFAEHSVNVRAEIAEGKIASSSRRTSECTPEPYDLQLYTSTRKYIKGIGKLDELSINSHTKVSLVRVAICVDDFSVQTTEEVWLVCTKEEEGVYAKRGIVLLAPASLYKGALRDIAIY